MGFSGIGIWQLIIVLVIVIVLFGTKRLKNIGGDLGSAIKGFKKSMKDDDTKTTSEIEPPKSEETTKSTKKDKV